MIRLIASDMDGTLLGAQLNISETNAQAIHEASRKGVTFMVSTGRGYMEAKPALDEAGIACPMITGNGAQIYDKDGTVLLTIGIPKANAQAIRTILDAHELYYEIATNKGVYSRNQAQRIENVATSLAEKFPHLTFKMALTMAAVHLELLHIQSTDNFETLIDEPDIEILKFIVFSQSGPQKLEPAAAEIRELTDLVITSSSFNNIEINHVHAQKGFAVAYLAKKWGIPLNQVMTIGDNLNDISMLALDCVSFAMANGHEETKKVAKYTTSTNLENGVGEAILRALNENL